MPKVKKVLVRPITEEEVDALKNWVSLNRYLKNNDVPVERLEVMVNHEAVNKKRFNVISRLNNKIFEKLRLKNLHKLMGIK